MKILLVQSYFRILDPKELERQMPYPPLGSIYAATMLKSLGFEIVFFDSMLAGSTDEAQKKIKELKPDVLLIYDDEFNYLTKMCLSNMRKAALNLISTAKELDIPVMVYSSDASDFSTPYFNEGCDVIIYGEGEITLIEIMNALDAGELETRKHNIEGIKFLSGSMINVNPGRKLIEDLDTLPFPDYSFVEMDRYRNVWLSNQGYFSLNISTTRGCPYRCNWCAKPLYGKSYQSRSVENVIDQIKILRSEYSIDHLWITDDIFGLKSGWISEFAEQSTKQNVIVPYKCLSRPDLLSRGNTIEDLKNSGCKTIWIGAESGSQKILNAMDKGTTVEQIYSVSELTAAHDIELAFFIQFGYPGELWEDILLTRKMIRDCMPADIGISVSYPLPGTKFYEKIKEELKEKQNWIDSDDLDLMFRGSYERSFYKLLHRFVHAEYRMVKIFKEKKFSRALKLLFYFLKFIFLRIKIQYYLKDENLQTAAELR